MPLFSLTKELIFPPVQFSEPDGLLAMGGDLSMERLLLGYRNGIFPWFEGDLPLWWCPDPRFVLFPSELKISKSMKQVINRQLFDFTIDQAFPAVINHCRNTPRKDQQGSWITEEVLSAYNSLHRLGYAHSAEAWQQGQLVGGCYGVRLGKVFFGESMFSKVANASKFAFIQYVQVLLQEEVALIDCQVYTQHLESLGARMIHREDFIPLLQSLIP